MLVNPEGLYKRGRVGHIRTEGREGKGERRVSGYGYFCLLAIHCHSLKSRYHLAAMESLLRRPSL